ncbi:MAG: Alkaline phosphatase synthesis transcriptional regulatory protein PhoP [Anaerolineales bacterium]|nr:Alkaline phosphatase synthesis transcriptional regulatory protein PhoP [Anaerolineales bacterium]
MKTILVVDDTASVRTLLQDYLTQQGYRVITAANGQDALYEARHSNPDAILLDIMMPKMDGFEFLRQYRKEKQTPVIVITAKEEETDAVLGLELGADDYVIKPFRMRELVSRVRAVLRRQESAADPSRTLQHGALMLDPATHTATVNGSPANLTPLEFDLLALLMSAPNRVYTREQISEKLSNSGFAGLERTLNVHIRNLRAKIESNPSDPKYIETVFGVGYRFRAE